VKLTIYLHLVPRFKNVWSYASTPPHVFMVWDLVNQRDIFTFTSISKRGSVTYPVQLPLGAFRKNFVLHTSSSIYRHIKTWKPAPEVPTFTTPHYPSTIRGCIHKFPDWPPGTRTANGPALCH